MLNTLDSLGIETGVITNNRFSEETVRWKLKRLFPDHNFDIVLSSTEECCHKPDRKIFEKALYKLNVEPEQVWFVGDSLEDDIKGSYQVGMRPFWVLKHAKVDATKIGHREDCTVIRDLKEIEEIILEGGKGDEKG